MYVRMYVCMYVCMHACMYVCMYVCVCLCMFYNVLCMHAAMDTAEVISRLRTRLWSTVSSWVLAGHRSYLDPKEPTSFRVPYYEFFI